MVREQETTRQHKQWEGWQLQGNSAEAYEEYLVPIFFAPGAQYLMDLAELGSDDRVLDVACGTGIVARSAVERVGSEGTVVGLDLNQSMLTVARNMSERVGATIEWRQGDATDLPFPHATFDVVFCQQGLQFFTDQQAALSEMHRVLAPDGRLALSLLRSVRHNPSYALLAEVLERHIGPEAGAMMRSPFAMLGPDDLRALITGAGFRDVQIFIGIGPIRFPSVEEFVRQEAASSPLAGPLGSMDSGTRESMLNDLRQALRPYTDDTGVVFPAETHLAIGRR